MQESNILPKKMRSKDLWIKRLVLGSLLFGPAAAPAPSERDTSLSPKYLRVGSIILCTASAYLLISIKV